MSHRTSSLFASLLLVACSESVPDSGDGSSTGTADDTSASTTVTPSTTAEATTESPADTSDDTSPGESSDTSTSEPEPVCDGACALVPDGWMGPVVAYDVAPGAEDPGCAGAFADEVGRYDAEFSAAAAECGCTCGEMIGASCTLPSMRYNLANCGVNTGASLNLVAGCNNISDIEDEGIIAFHLTEPQLTPAPCEAVPSVEIPEAGFGHEVVLCGGTLDDLGCAAGESCVPPEHEAVCIWAEGEQACPAEFPATTVLYDGFEDTRGCSECTCGDPDPNSECVTRNDASLHADSNACAGGVDGTVEVGSCTETTGIVRSIYLWEAQPPTGACPPSAVEATGDAVPTGAATLCCTG